MNNYMYIARVIVLVQMIVSFQLMAVAPAITLSLPQDRSCSKINVPNDIQLLVDYSGDSLGATSFANQSCVNFSTSTPVSSLTVIDGDSAGYESDVFMQLNPITPGFFTDNSAKCTVSGAVDNSLGESTPFTYDHFVLTTPPEISYFIEGYEEGSVTQVDSSVTNVWLDGGLDTPYRNVNLCFRQEASPDNGGGVTFFSPTDLYLLNVAVNGVDVTSVDNVGRACYFLFSQNIPIDTGTNNVVVQVSDCAGNVGMTRSFSIDRLSGPLPQVTDLTASSLPSGRSAQLNWTYPVGAVDRFALYQKSGSGFTSTDDVGITLVANGINSNARQWQVNGLTPNETVYFAVVAESVSGVFDTNVIAAPVTLVDSIAPFDVGDYILTRGDQELITSWSEPNDLSDIDHYEIFQDGVVSVANIPAVSTSYILVGLNAGQTYTIQIFSVDSSGNRSPGVTRTSRPYYPAPTNVVVSNTNLGFQMQWDQVNFNEQPSKYAIYYSAQAFTNINDAGLTRNITSGSFTSFNVYDLPLGSTYYVAVNAVERVGFNDYENPEITSIGPITIVDLDPPPLVQISQILSFESSVQIDWLALNEPDLASYELTIDGAITVLDAAQTSYTINGEAATGYQAQLLARDTSGNASSINNLSVSYPLSTWLINPLNLQTTSQDSSVQLTWDPVADSALLFNYAIYQSNSDIVDVSALTPVATSNTNAFTASGLSNNATYYFAVSAINHLNGENPIVVSQSAIPRSDVTDPVISNISVNGQDPSLGTLTLTQISSITATATDDSGIARVEFISQSGVLNTSDANGTTNYSAIWDINDESDGLTNLTLTAYDTTGNSTELIFPINIALAPPSTPLLSQPGNGLITNQPSVLVTGSSDLNTSVQLTLNGVDGVQFTVDSNGNFSRSINLIDNLGVNPGDPSVNTLSARAINRVGNSNDSSPINITLDSSIPDQPVGLTAVAQAVGEIKLLWNPVSSGSAITYDLYRSTSANFTTSNKLNLSPINISNYSNTPVLESTYYYRVVAINYLGTASAPSDIVSALSDATLPSAVFTYVSDGLVNGTTGAFASGFVTVTMDFSEVLLTKPFVSIVPTGSAPITLNLIQQSDVQYTATFEIDASTGSGDAFAIMSAYDKVGNRGTTVSPPGDIIIIDTQGPSPLTMSVTPMEPINNDATPLISVTMDLDEATVGIPTLSYQLSVSQAQAIVIGDMVNPTGNTWTVDFTLPSNAGLITENLSFQLNSLDALGNAGIIANTLDNSFQVYQNDLPPLDPPTGLIGIAIADGFVELSWQPVNDAAGYAVFRKDPGSVDFIEISRTSEGVTQTTEQVGIGGVGDGSYDYAVASIRTVSAVDAVSSQSNSDTLIVDSIPPLAVVDGSFSLSLTGAGVKAIWQEPADMDILTYNLYRGPTPIADVSALTAVISGISGSSVIDPNPVSSDANYVITVSDLVGNESLPSISIVQDVSLLAIDSLSILREGINDPVISWTHPVYTSFRLQAIVDGASYTLGADPTNDLSYIDTAYNGEARRYSVITFDNTPELNPSPSRVLLLPEIDIRLDEDSVVRRGLMNGINFSVTNHMAQSIDLLHLNATLNGIDHQSSQFSLDAFEERSIEIIIPGYNGLQDLESSSVSLQYEPLQGELVELRQTETLAISNGGLIVNLVTDNFIRGGQGQVRLEVTNPGSETIEWLMASNTGSQPATDLNQLWLLDTDDNVIAVNRFNQAFGNGIITLNNGETVARIPAGETVLLAPLSIDIPSAAPEQMQVKIDVDTIYYRRAQTNELSMNGFSSRKPVNLVDTAYYGELIDSAPLTSYGNQPIRIRGQAVNRNDGLPLPTVALKLVISVNGFERAIEVFTDLMGQFSYDFVPLPNESGSYQVSVVHPDITDRPNHGQFVIGKVTASPRAYNISAAITASTQLDFTLSAGDGTVESNVQLVYTGCVQAGAIDPAISVINSELIPVLADGEQADIFVSITADTTPISSTGTLNLCLVSDSATLASPLTVIPVNYVFSDAIPLIAPSPGIFELGVTKSASGGANVSASGVVTLSNQGFAPTINFNIELKQANGNAPPSWITINTADLGELDVGASITLPIVLDVPSTINPQIYEFELEMTADNFPIIYRYPLFIAVAQSGIGGVSFHVSDIYTLTGDGNGGFIQGVDNARIQITNEQQFFNAATLVPEEYYTANGGEVLIQNLAAGRYSFRISADNHVDTSGLLTIQPGLTLSQEVFIEYNLVQVNWSVTEIPLEDRYEIVLSVTFESDVPAAVIIMQPSNITVPSMREGDVFNGELTISNEGLIEAFDVHLVLPESSNSFFDIEFLGELPDTLSARQAIILPYRIRALKSLVSSDYGTHGAGGDCVSIRELVSASGKYICANGTISGNGASTLINTRLGNCTSEGGQGGPVGGRDGGGSDPCYFWTGPRDGAFCNGPDGGLNNIKSSCSPNCTSGQCCSGPSSPPGFGGGGGGGGGGPGGGDFGNGPGGFRGNPSGVSGG